MKNYIATTLVLSCVVAAGCGGGDEKLTAGAQPQYEVVQEGAASGVSPTLAAGTTLPPLTNTNADTTSAFTLDPNAVAATQAQPAGTIAGTLPPPMTSGTDWGTAPPPDFRAAPQPRRATAPRPAARPAYPAASSPTPAPARSPEPVRSEPAEVTHSAPPESAPPPAPAEPAPSAEPAPAAEPAEPEPTTEPESAHPPPTPPR